jgi:hypothetical protein
MEKPARKKYEKSRLQIHKEYTKKQKGDPAVKWHVLPVHDYLKYWRVVKHWARRKYNLSTPTIETILFLYSEKLFTHKTFTKVTGTLSLDSSRLERYKKMGILVQWREYDRGKHEAALYELSRPYKLMCTTIYKMLVGEISMSENPKLNPIFDEETNTKVDKKYIKIVKLMNEQTKEARSHLSRRSL